MKLSGLNMGINYQKALDIEESMLQYVLANCIKVNGVYVPPTIDLNFRTFFAIDNFDLSRDTKDGKIQWHFTIITLFQNSWTAINPYLHGEVSLLRGKELHSKIREIPEVPPVRDPCYPPTLTKDSTPLNDKYRNIVSIDEQIALRNDESWLMLQSNTKSTDVPTWKALNSRITPAAGITTTAILPLIKSPPTEWDTLLKALLQCEHVSSITAKGKKTIITLDLQLYYKGCSVGYG